MENINEIFWDSTVEEIKQGYVFISTTNEYVCLICGESFEKGVIYPQGELFCDAEKAAKVHIHKKHGSVFEYLVNMSKKYTGLTETQKELLKYFYKGFSDKEIVDAQGVGSTSTIRNHRFKLKEKEKQAKVFLAIMELLESRKENEKFISIHRGATMVDDRYAVTEKERERIVKNYFKEGNNGRLSVFPSKEKRKIVILQHIMKRFNPNQKYTEKEVNNILKEIYEDYVTIRRYLIEYGFMERNKDCSLYWVKL